MARPRKTEGDRAVERLKAALADRLGLEGVDQLRLDPDEAERMRLLKATADEIESMEAAWRREQDEGRTLIRGSRGQDVLNPLPAEIRTQRQFLNALLKGFRWDAGASRLSASERGRQAANVRHNGSPAGIAQMRETALKRWGP